MSYKVQQEDIALLHQRSKEIYCKVELLNKSFKVVDALNGVVTAGTVNISAESSTRRSLNLSMLVLNGSFSIGEDKKIWLSRYLMAYMGFKNLRTSEIKYYPIGIFSITQNNFVYNSVTHTLSISALDLMSELDGTRNGVIGKADILIPAGEDIRGAIVSTITQLGKIKKYIVQDISEEVPYDLNFSRGSTVENIIKTLVNLYPAREMFFDVDGTFICQEIPTCVDDNIIMDNENIQKLLIDSSVEVSFVEMKNTTEVFGALNDCDRFCDNCTNTDSQYILTIPLFELKERMTIGFIPNVTSTANAVIKINELPPFPICNENGDPISANKLIADTAYVVRYKKEKFYLLGEFQIYGIAYDDNPDSPFFVGYNRENIVLQTFDGGEYEKIWSDELAHERAEYENWKSARLCDRISLQMILIPWLDVNQKFEFQPEGTDSVHQYIIKDISLDILACTMSISAVRFYPLYPNIVSKSHN